MNEVLPSKITTRGLPAVVRKDVAAATERLPCPVEIKEAVKAIQACSDLLHLKHWGTKADALAAWAKIYNDDKVGVEARRLKLRVFRRASKLAEQLRPKGRRQADNGRQAPGPVSLMLEEGWRKNHAQEARAVGGVSDEVFDQLLTSKRPPTPSSVFKMHSGNLGQSRRSSDSWKLLWTSSHTSLYAALSVCRKHKGRAAELASCLGQEEANRAREHVREIMEWLDEYEQHLPKASKRAA